MVCRDNKLRLIPVVLIITALVSFLVFSFVNFAVFVPAFTIYPFSLVTSFVILLVTAVFAFICAFHGYNVDECKIKACGLLKCYGPIVLIAATGSLILSFIGIAGVDFSTIPTLGAILNIIFGVISALFFSTTIVYFVAMVFAFISHRN